MKKAIFSIENSYLRKESETDKHEIENGKGYAE